MRRLERTLTEIAVSLVFIILAMVLFGIHEKKTEEKPVKEPATKREADQEMRGVWVASVENLDYPKVPAVSAQELRAQADAVLEGADKNGFNTVFLQVRPCSDALYVSEIYPWSRYLTGQQGVAPDSDFDPLAYWVSEAHRRGLELHAWLNPYRIAKGQAEWESLSEESPARQHPEWVVQYGEGYYFDPALPEVRQLVLEGAMEIVENYNVDGIHLDDYFYPGPDFNDGDSYAAYGAEFGDIGDFRRNNVNLLVSGLDTAVHEAKPDIEFGISPSGIWASNTLHPEGSATTSGFSSYFSLYADSRAWVREGWVDYIAPQIYWEMGHEKADFSALLNWWSDVAKEAKEKKVSLYVGLADYKTAEAGEDGNNPWYGGGELQRQMEACSSNEVVGGTIHFRYGLIESCPAVKQVVGEAYLSDEK